MVRAIAWVSASFVSAMNWGTARRGGAPPSPVIVVVISPGCCARGRGSGRRLLRARAQRDETATAAAVAMRVTRMVLRPVSNIRFTVGTES